MSSRRLDRVEGGEEKNKRTVDKECCIDDKTGSKPVGLKNCAASRTYKNQKIPNSLPLLLPNDRSPRSREQPCT